MSKDIEYTRITLRIPTLLHGKLSDEAAIASRSMNAEIVSRITSSFSVAEQGNQYSLTVPEDLLPILAQEIADRMKLDPPPEAPTERELET